MRGLLALMFGAVFATFISLPTAGYAAGGGAVQHPGDVTNNWTGILVSEEEMCGFKTHPISAVVDGDKIVIRTRDYDSEVKLEGKIEKDGSVDFWGEGNSWQIDTYSSGDIDQNPKVTGYFENNKFVGDIFAGGKNYICLAHFELEKVEASASAALNNWTGILTSNDEVCGFETHPITAVVNGNDIVIHTRDVDSEIKLEGKIEKDGSVDFWGEADSWQLKRDHASSAKGPKVTGEFNQNKFSGDIYVGGSLICSAHFEMENADIVFNTKEQSFEIKTAEVKTRELKRRIEEKQKDRELADLRRKIESERQAKLKVERQKRLQAEAVKRGKKERENAKRLALLKEKARLKAVEDKKRAETESNRLAALEKKRRAEQERQVRLKAERLKRLNAERAKAKKLARLKEQARLKAIEDKKRVEAEKKRLAALEKARRAEKERQAQLNAEAERKKKQAARPAAQSNLLAELKTLNDVYKAGLIGQPEFEATKQALMVRRFGNAAQPVQTAKAHPLACYAVAATHFGARGVLQWVPAAPGGPPCRWAYGAAHPARRDSLAP